MKILYYKAVVLNAAGHKKAFKNVHFVFLTKYDIVVMGKKTKLFLIFRKKLLTRFSK